MAALKRLRDDISSLDLHAHKRATVVMWIDTHMAAIVLNVVPMEAAK